MMYTLRFDVETLIIATYDSGRSLDRRLRFDVETLIIATTGRNLTNFRRLRFDVETLIIATFLTCYKLVKSCGLM